MSDNFFSVMGEQLYKIKNSPFFKIGQVPKSTSQHSVETLSFDPNRLFKPQQSLNLDSDYIQFKHEEENQVQQIEFELLKRDINLQYQNKIQNTNLLATHLHTQPYTIFKTYRAACSACKECPHYIGNFNYSNDNCEYMLCIKCGCAMNSHAKMLLSNSHHDMIWKNLQSRSIEDHHLNNNYMVMVVKVKDVKHDIYLLMELMGQVGYVCEEVKETTKRSIEINLVKCMILSQGIQKLYIESLLNLLEYLEVQPQSKWISQNITQHLQQQFQTVKRIAMQLNLQIKEDERVYTLLLRCGVQPRFGQFSKLIQSIGEPMHPFKYVWSANNNKQVILSAQQLFPERFKLRKSIFLLPSGTHFAKQSDRLKDALDYNEYIVMVENIKNVERNVVEKALSWLPYSKLNYILGEEIVSEKISRIGIKVSYKVGRASLIIPFSDCPDYICINKAEDVGTVLSHLYPTFSYSQRCAIIIRPFVVSYNYEEIIVNLLRTNEFILLKRVKVKLDGAQARYLGVLQHIEESKMEQYVEWMCSGVSEIVLVSKRSAIYEAHALCQGCEDGINHITTASLKQNPIIQFKRGSQIYEYSMERNNHTKMSNFFDSVSRLIKVEDVLFGKRRGEKRMAKNVRTGSYLEVEGQQKGENGLLKVGIKTKESIVKSLKNDSFNYWVYTSKSETITQEIASIFMPQSTLFDSIILILKPGYTHLCTLVSNALIQHKYHIIMQKTVILSKIIAAELILGLQKVKMKKEELRQIIQVYSTEKIHLYIVSKVSAKNEMLSMLSQFTFLGRKPIIQSQISDQNFKQILIPVWKPINSLSSILSSTLSSLQQSIKNLNSEMLSVEEKVQLLNYLVGSMMGVSIKDLSMKSSIGVLTYYISELKVAHLQSWYYSQISMIYPNYVPLIFQHRQFGNITLCIQNKNGFPFLGMINDQYQTEMEKLKVSIEKRKSMVLFLWGKKLAEVLIALSEKECQLKGLGDIVWNQGEYQGQKTVQKMIVDEKMMIELVEQKLGKNASRETIKNINRVKQSHMLSQRYEAQHRRIIPSFKTQPIEEAIRIVQTQQTSKLQLIDKYSMIDPENQKTNITDLYTINLYNILPSINTKYAMMADLCFFLVKCSREALDNNQMFQQIGTIINQFLMAQVDIEMLELEIYMRYLEAYSKGEQWIMPLLKSYPSLRSEGEPRGQEHTGKKRKFLEQKQYFKTTTVDSEHLESKLQKYRHFDLNTLTNPIQPTVLFDPKDPLHKQWAYPDRTISLLREEEYHPVKKGIYVEFEKKITENEQLILKKIKNQVDKIHFNQQHQIIYENGLQDKLWYRRVKGAQSVPKKTKTEDAINKQIGKFLNFISNEKSKQ